MKPVAENVKLAEVELEVLNFWEENETFAKTLAKTRQQPPFIFYDGPPFATGLPHYGHLLAGTIKDIIPRFWTMRGYYVDRRFGWDCHGLPVELEIEQNLGLNGKSDIERFGVELASNPFQKFLEFRMMGIPDGFQKIFEAPDSSDVFGGTGTGPGKAHGGTHVLLQWKNLVHLSKTGHANSVCSGPLSTNVR